MRRKLISNDEDFVNGFINECKCRNGFHDQTKGEKYILPAYPPALCERISQLLTHNSHSTIKRFMDIAMRITEDFQDDEAKSQDLCVVCNSDYMEGSGLFDKSVLILFVLIRV